jgi:hypothetical protein
VTPVVFMREFYDRAPAGAPRSWQKAVAGRYNSP